MKNYSIAIFGSSLRSDFDKYSDKDLLIAADSYATLKEIKKKYSEKDWSISYYTYSKLQYLSKNGSLFIKHLRNESQIKIDNDSNLKNILENFKEKKDYTNDIIDCKRYFDILYTIPDTVYGYAWFCDSFYVGFRNYLIFKNAQNGIFEFSFNKLLKLLIFEKIITISDFQILKELRVVKRNYRDDIINEFPSREFVLRISKIAYHLDLLSKCKIIPSQDFNPLLENDIINNKYSPYQKLRLVEAYYCSQNKSIPKIKKIISNPQFYASKLKDNNYTLELINMIKNNSSRKINKIIEIDNSLS